VVCIYHYCEGSEIAYVRILLSFYVGTIGIQGILSGFGPRSSLEISHCRRVCKIAESGCYFRLVFLSVLFHETTRFLLEALSRNLIFEHFTKFWRKKSNFIAMWQE